MWRASWTQPGYPRLWNIILSQKFGERLDIQQLTHSVMAGVEGKTGAGGEWIAVAHYNAARLRRTGARRSWAIAHESKRWRHNGGR